MTAGKEWRSGHCAIDHKPDSDSHKRCVGALVCVCDCHPAGSVTALYEAGYKDAVDHAENAATFAADPVAWLTDAVKFLADAAPGLLDACTDPQATDMAELLHDVNAARVALYAIERDIETTLAKAMLGDDVATPTLRVERYRSTDRKAWDHDGWKRDVRAKALQAHGLKGAGGIITADGEVVDPALLHTLLAAVQDAHGATAPKTGTLKKLGLDARDYCESSPGAWHVKVQRIADESTEDGAA